MQDLCNVQGDLSGLILGFDDFDLDIPLPATLRLGRGKLGIIGWAIWQNFQIEVNKS